MFKKKLEEILNVLSRDMEYIFLKSRCLKIKLQCLRFKKYLDRINKRLDIL